MSSHPVDIHVGTKLRTKRTMMGLSQEALGEAVGITFQQIQRYEKGLNRIGSSRLYEFACILKTNVAYFFEDISTGSKGNSLLAHAAESEDGFQYDHLGNKEVLSLVRAFNNITDPLVRKRILHLLKSLADTDALSPEEPILGATPQDFDPEMADIGNDTFMHKKI